MIIMGIVAGLGNQMFQYALGKKLSIKHKQPFCLDIDPLHYDIRNYELHVFNITPTFATSHEKYRYLKLWKKPFIDKIWYPIKRLTKKLDRKYIIENPKHPVVHKSMFDYRADVANLKGDYYLEGFWQSEKYFKDIEPIIREEFTLKHPLSDKQNIAILEKIQTTNAVSLHVRRSDYIGSDFAGIATLEYYERAIQYIKNIIPNAVFFVFSDDMVWTKEHIQTGYETYYIDWNTKENNYKDLVLMSACKHNIIANSSFSWWGARLNNNTEKIVIAPVKRHQKLDYKDIVPSSRIRL